MLTNTEITDRLSASRSFAGFPPTTHEISKEGRAGGIPRSGAAIIEALRRSRSTDKGTPLLVSVSTLTNALMMMLNLTVEPWLP
jgi:hypothetical protein